MVSEDLVHGQLTPREEPHSKKMRQREAAQCQFMMARKQSRQQASVEEARGQGSTHPWTDTKDIKLTLLDCHSNRTKVTTNISPLMNKNTEIENVT